MRSIDSASVEAMAFLLQVGAYATQPLPDLVLLDLQLPGLSGIRVLRAVKAERDIQHIPVIIVSASALEEDVHQAMRLQASLYLRKPFDADEYVDLVQEIEEFWLDHLSQASDRETDPVGQLGKVGL